MASSGEFDPRTCGRHETHKHRKKVQEKASEWLVCWTLGDWRRRVALRRDGLCERGPAPSADIKSSDQAAKKHMILVALLGSIHKKNVLSDDFFSYQISFDHFSLNVRRPFIIKKKKTPLCVFSL